MGTGGGGCLPDPELVAEWEPELPASNARIAARSLSLTVCGNPATQIASVRGLMASTFMRARQAEGGAQRI